MTRIVFSKDRALQLHAFLRSYQDQVALRAEMSVLYRATTARHARAYVDVFHQFPWVRPVQQSASFKADLLDLLPSDGPAILFADDHLFVRPWVEQDTPINLHLGLNLSHCYTLGLPQPVPTHSLVEPDTMTWRWADGQYDWGYPLAIGGHVIDLAEWRPMIAAVPFSSPNTLESALQVYRAEFLPRSGCCYRQSKLVLLPWNRVQNECQNRIASGYPSADALLEQWAAGLQVNLTRLYGVQNTSVHQALPLVLETR